MNKVPLAGGQQGNLQVVETGGLRIAVEGCCHGALEEIYREILGLFEEVSRCSG